MPWRTERTYPFSSECNPHIISCLYIHKIRCNIPSQIVKRTKQSSWSVPIWKKSSCEHFFRSLLGVEDLLNFFFDVFPFLRLLLPVHDLFLNFISYFLFSFYIIAQQYYYLLLFFIFHLVEFSLYFNEKSCVNGNSVFFVVFNTTEISCYKKALFPYLFMYVKIYIYFLEKKS